MNTGSGVCVLSYSAMPSLTCVYVCKCTDTDLEGYELIVNKWYLRGKNKMGQRRGGGEDFNFISYICLYYFTF